MNSATRKLLLEILPKKLKFKNPLLYYYFKSKEELLFEIIESIGLKITNALEEG